MTESADALRYEYIHALCLRASMPEDAEMPRFCDELRTQMTDEQRAEVDAAVAGARPFWVPDFGGVGARNEGKWVLDSGWWCDLSGMWEPCPDPVGGNGLIFETEADALEFLAEQAKEEEARATALVQTHHERRIEISARIQALRLAEKAK